MMENHSSCSCKQEKEVLKLDSMPLAMAYVPWQKWQNIYKPENALCAGTIFQELDLPFTGRRCQKWCRICILLKTTLRKTVTWTPVSIILWTAILMVIPVVILTLAVTSAATLILPATITETKIVTVTWISRI